MSIMAVASQPAVGLISLLRQPAQPSCHARTAPTSNATVAAGETTRCTGVGFAFVCLGRMTAEAHAFE